MIDASAFADEVSTLLKGKFHRDNMPETERKTAFDHAFNEVADKHHILGIARGALKQEVGSILAKRPRKTGVKKEQEHTAKTPAQFTVIASKEESVEFISKDKISFKFGKRDDGISFLRVYSGTHHPTMQLLKEAEGFAKAHFAAHQAPTPQKPAPIIQMEASPSHLLLVLDGAFEALFAPGKKYVKASVTKLRAPCLQKDVPPELMEKARAIAVQYFKGASTLPLDL